MTSRLVFAHGFTQTSRSWDDLRGRLARAGITDTVAVDLPGHGSAATIARDLWGCADHLVDTGGPGVYVGYSMGGRIALHAALAHPTAVERLVLIGATAGIDDDGERASRRDADEALAERIAAIGVTRFVDEWLASPLFAGLDEPGAQREDRRRNSASGLASSLRLAGTGTQDPLWDRLHEVEQPVLVVVGAHDDKFRRIGERMVDGLPHATLRVVDGAGHSVHLERPVATAAALVDWLAATAVSESEADGGEHPDREL